MLSDREHPGSSQAAVYKFGVTIMISSYTEYIISYLSLATIFVRCLRCTQSINQSINQSFIKYIRLTKTQSNLQASVQNFDTLSTKLSVQIVTSNIPTSITLYHLEK